MSPHNPNNNLNANGAGHPPDSCPPTPTPLDRLRASSLVRHPGHRINAEPNVPSPNVNPWSAARPLSPVERTGISFAEMVTRPPSPRNSAGEVATGQPIVDVNIADANTGADPTTQSQDPTIVRNSEVAEETENVENVGDIENIENIDNGHETDKGETQTTVPTRTSRAKRNKGKGKAKKSKLAPTTENDEGATSITNTVTTTTATSDQVVADTPQQNTRVVSDSRTKRRRVETDVGGRDDTTNARLRERNMQQQGAMDDLSTQPAPSTDVDQDGNTTMYDPDPDSRTNPDDELRRQQRAARARNTSPATWTLHARPITMDGPAYPNAGPRTTRVHGMLPVDWYEDDHSIEGENTS
ncbi:hypothetical protein EVJ58_g5526 [Rhodofomes roseus]|uniref:Uncharacterized protein n=1 Tax=Rhodofomes roseus TaxID=34475 RepID=A0A4Y9YG16_9APHY|nr:hypothetical protein EVJ58_g5526 [Rhodofomes roseus]